MRCWVGWVRGGEVGGYGMSELEMERVDAGWIRVTRSTLSTIYSLCFPFRFTRLSAYRVIQASFLTQQRDRMIFSSVFLFVLLGCSQLDVTCLTSAVTPSTTFSSDGVLSTVSGGTSE